MTFDKPEIITDPRYGISYQRIPTDFRLFLVEGLDNLGQPVAFVVQATALDKAVSAAVEEVFEYEAGVRNRHLMKVTRVQEVYQTERDAAPDSTQIIANFRAWAIQNLTSIAAEVQRDRERGAADQ